MHHLIVGDDEFEVVDSAARNDINVNQQYISDINDEISGTNGINAKLLDHEMMFDRHLQSTLDQDLYTAETEIDILQSQMRSAQLDIYNLETAAGAAGDTVIESHTGFANLTTPSVNIIKLGNLALLYVLGNVADETAGATIVLKDAYKPKNMGGTGVMSNWPLIGSPSLNSSAKSGDLYSANIAVAGTSRGTIYLWPPVAGMMKAFGFYALA